MRILIFQFLHYACGKLLVELILWNLKFPPVAIMAIAIKPGRMVEFSGLNWTWTDDSLTLTWCWSAIRIWFALKTYSKCQVSLKRKDRPILPEVEIVYFWKKRHWLWNHWSRHITKNCLRIWSQTTFTTTVVQCQEPREEETNHGWFPKWILIIRLKILSTNQKTLSNISR